MAQVAERKLYQVRISPTIANEYSVRSVFSGETEDDPYVPGTAGTYQLPITTVRAIHDDADHQVETCWTLAKCEDSGERDIRNSYLALRSQTSDTLRGAGIKP